MSSLNYWKSNINYKTKSLGNLFGVCVVFASVVSMFVLAFGSVSIADIAFIPLLVLTIVAAFPYIEVAIRVDTDKTRPHALTSKTYKNGMQTNTRYTILSSRLAMMQPVYAFLCIGSFLMFSIHKILGNNYIHKKVIVALLLMQIPLNPLLGFNPIATRLIRTSESRFIRQENVHRSIQSNMTIMDSYKPKNSGLFRNTTIKATELTRANVSGIPEMRPNITYDKPDKPTERTKTNNSLKKMLETLRQT